MKNVYREQREAAYEKLLLKQKYPEQAPLVIQVQEQQDNLPTGTSIDTNISMDDFIGQLRAKKLVNLSIDAWKKDPDKVPGHMLFTGSGGTGKSAIAHAVANSMGNKFITTTPYQLRKPEQIFDFFFEKDYTCKINQGDIIFIDEVHGFNMRMAAYMYNVLQDFCFDWVDPQTKQNMRLYIPRFLAIGATTDAGMMHAPLRSRFVNRIEFEDYTAEELAEIVSRKYPMEHEAAMEIGQRSSGNPRKALALAQLSSLIQSKYDHMTVKENDVWEACEINNIDEKGLDTNAKRVVDYYVKTGNKAAGTNPVSASTGIYKTTLEGETFPAMAYAGVLVYTARGKCLTEEYYQEQKGQG